MSTRHVGDGAACAAFVCRLFAGVRRPSVVQLLRLLFTACDAPHLAEVGNS